MKKQKNIQADLISQLFKEALNIKKGESYCQDNIMKLQMLGNIQVVEKAVKLVNSYKVWDRIVAARLLGQSGHNNNFLRKYRQNVLIESLNIEKEPDVLAAIISAIGHFSVKSLITRVICFSEHFSIDVRGAVAYALNCCQNHSPRMISVLERLCQDSDDQVRNWAITALGDSETKLREKSRQALILNLTSKNKNLKNQAVCALASHKDEYVKENFLCLLKEEVNCETIIAAERSEWTEVLPILIFHKKNTKIQDAITEIFLEKAIFSFGDSVKYDDLNKQ